MALARIARNMRTLAWSLIPQCTFFPWKDNPYSAEPKSLLWNQILEEKFPDSVKNAGSPVGKIDFTQAKSI
ncbi:MAG TPA: hypothetical protein ENK26_14045 [Gammaproteobacteria bacterium]|nr:hypothetical protein [Gammaproteobacteria bacterium]